MNIGSQGHLPRLERAWYTGRAFVFWTHTIEDRATGWLTPSFHAQFRELLLHCTARHALACPVYVLMPDHWHLLTCGLAEDSDQLDAMRMFRRHVGHLLGHTRLQHQPHDHVLRDVECDPDRVAETSRYLRENPVRAGLCSDWRDWAFGGTIIPGFPDLQPAQEDFWTRFWRIYNRLVAPDPRSCDRESAGSGQAQARRCHQRGYELRPGHE